ncbi:MAG TPA: hypothetical protein VN624_17770 [Rhodanobacter sp.]|nr:hypothetical protein [Rhodanobacter sp.]
MAIPRAHESEQVAAAKARFEQVGVGGLKSLRDEDALLIGKVILMFSFNELNLRRVVEILCAKGFLQLRKKFETFELVEVVKEGIAKAFPSDGQLSDDLAKLDEIEFRRPFRNMFAHWAAKRLDGTDSIVFMTKDSKDEKAVHGLSTIGAYGITYSVMMIEDIRGLLNNIDKYGEWLALRTSSWHLAMGCDP